VDDVVRTHHAVVYEIPTAAAPEKTIMASRKERLSTGLQSVLATMAQQPRATYKFTDKFSQVQFSTRSVATTRTGIERRLL
jgi:hypothetical protein